MSASAAAYASMQSAGHRLLGCWALSLEILVLQTRNDADTSPCVPHHYIILDHVSETAHASCPRVWVTVLSYRWLRPPCYEWSVSPISAYWPEQLGSSCRLVKSLNRQFTGLARH